MKLHKKTFIFSATISLIAVFIVIAYFIVMLPALYLSYSKDSHFYKVKQQNMNVYNDIESFDASIQFYTFEIPNNSYELSINSGYGKTIMTINDLALQEKMDEYRSYFNGNTKSFDDFPTIDFDSLIDQIFNRNLNDLFEFQFIANENITLEKNSTKFHQLKKDHVYLGEVVSKQFDSFYINYIGIINKDDSLIFTFAPYVLPSMVEIRPLILMALPGIILLMSLVTLIVSSIYSKRIVKPIVHIKDQAQLMVQKPDQYHEIHSLTKDELADLTEVLNILHKQQSNHLQIITNQNALLHYQQTFQENFMKSASHQLKTPVSTALLLIDSMIDKLGKYRDTDAYLPEVKKSLIEMNQIISEILETNTEVLLEQFEDIDLLYQIEKILTSYQIIQESKNIHLILNIEPITIRTNAHLLYKIIETLLNNAFKYCIPKGIISIDWNQNTLIIFNRCNPIPNNIYKDIYEPFVSSSIDRSSHGLGLYLVQVFCKQLRISVEIDNLDDGVKVMLTFPDSSIV